MGCFNNISLFLVIVIYYVSNAELSRLEPNRYDKGPQKLYSKQIGYDGDSLIIGSTYEREITEKQIKDVSPTSLYKCTISSIAPEHEESIQTKVMRRPSRSYLVDPSEQMEPVTFSEYFHHVTKEVWLCGDPTNEKLPEFYRVVNELISFKDIFEIKYYPNIDVSSVEYLGISNTRSAKIREIKLLIKEGENLVTLKFDSELTLEDDASKQHSIPNLIEYLHTMETKKPRNSSEPGMRIDSIFRDESKTILNSIPISSTGEVMKVGSMWYKRYEGGIGQQSTDTVCKREQGVDIPHLFTPECFRRYDIDGSETKIYGKITEQDFQKMFTVASREVWLCTGKDTLIYRVVNLVIGRVPIKEIEYEDGITSIYSINIPGGISVGFKEISYFDAYTLKRSEYEVVHRLDENTLMASKLKNSKNIKDIKFELLPMAIYKNLINTEGHDIRIGSKPTRVLGEKDSPVMCTEVNSNDFQRDFQTQLRLKMIVDNVIQIMRLIEDNEESKQIFKYTSKRVWTCRSSVPELLFLRIVNVLQVLVPVREIETFDGVELVEKPVSNGSIKLLEIHETKYLRPNNEEPIIYLGDLEFKDVADINTLSEKSGPEKLRKSLDETSPLMGPLATKYCYMHLQDLNSLDPKTELSRVTIGTGDNLMRFEVLPEKDNSITDFFECKSTEASPKLFASFDILDKSQSQLFVVERLKDEEKSSQYLQLEEIKIWNCVSSKSDNNFYRVVINQRLKKNTPLAIGEVQYSEYDRVWIEMLDAAEYVVKFQQIRYVNTVDDQLDPHILNFNGHFFLQKAPGLRTCMIHYEKQFGQNDLDRPKLYMDEVRLGFSSLNTPKISLEIGTKWKRVFGNKNMIITCERIENGDGNNHLPEVREKESDVMNEDVDLFHSYFNLLKQEQWTCTDETGNHILRIQNQFSMKPTGEIPRPIYRFSYYDGVSVSYGYKSEPSSEFDCEIIEIKYLDLNGEVVSKFPGKVQLQGQNEKLKLISLSNKELDQNYKKDIHYFLDEPYKVYSTPIDRNGMIIEVGPKYFEKPHVRCELTCRKPAITNDNDMLEYLLPEVAIVWSRPKDQENSILPLNREKLSNFFDLEQSHWMCKCAENGEELIRIVSTLKLKPAHTVSNVYHYDGVTVDNSDNTLTIVETKYVKAFDRTIVKFDHYMKFEDAQNEGPEASEEAQNQAPIREAHFLDTEVMNSAKLSSTGVLLLVGSKWQDTLESSNDQRLVCEEVEDNSFKRELDLKMFISLENVPNVSPENPWSEELNMTDGFFHLASQLRWNCIRNEEVILHRVVNKRFILGQQKVRRIFYYDGVTVETVKLPKNVDALQITEVKFVDTKMEKVVKYDGEFFIRSNKIVEDLFQKPNELRESKVFIRPDSSFGNYYSLDFLIASVYRNRHERREKSTGEDSAGGRTIEGVSYRASHLDKYSSIILDDGKYFHRIFEIGTLYEKELPKIDNKIMDCVLDIWNPVKRHHYIPRVIEFIDDKEFHFDGDEFLELFKIKSTKVWICSNGEQFLLRVKTNFIGKVPMFAVRYTDGVEVTKSKISLELAPTSSTFYTANVTEIIYLDPWTSRVLKYEGDLQEVTYPYGYLYNPREEEKTGTWEFKKAIGRSINYVKSKVRPVLNLRKSEGALQNL